MPEHFQAKRPQGVKAIFCRRSAVFISSLAKFLLRMVISFAWDVSVFLQGKLQRSFFHSEKYKSMFRRPQNGRSMSTESSNRSGEYIFFLPRRENMTIGCTLSSKFSISIADLKVVSRTLENKNSIMSKLNSTFVTNGNATADKKP